MSKSRSSKSPAIASVAKQIGLSSAVRSVGVRQVPGATAGADAKPDASATRPKESGPVPPPVNPIRPNSPPPAKSETRPGEATRPDVSATRPTEPRPTESASPQESASGSGGILAGLMESVQSAGGISQVVGAVASQAFGDKQSHRDSGESKLPANLRPSFSGDPDQSQGEMSGIDKLQMTLDAVGIFEPTPFADGTNAAISTVRAFREPERRGEHIRNAAISTASAVLPYVGDATKVLKYGAKGAKGAKAAKASGTATKSGKAGKPSRWRMPKSAAANPGATTSEKSRGMLEKAIDATRPIRKAAAALPPVQSPANQQTQPAAVASPPQPGQLPVSPMPQAPGSEAGRHIEPPPTPTPSVHYPPGVEPPVIEPGQAAGHGGRSTNTATEPPGATPGPSQSAPSPPQTTGQRMAAVGRGIGSAFTAAFGNRSGGSGGSGRGGQGGQNDQPGADGHNGQTGPANTNTATGSGMAGVLGQGSNFGDVMGGKKTADQAREEVEGNERIDESKNKLSDVTKKLAGTFGALVVGSVGLVKSVKAVSSALVEKQRHLEEFSGGIAAAMSKLDADRIQRDMQTAAGTAGSTRRLGEAQSGLEEAIRPWQAATTNTLNTVVEKLDKLVTFGVTIVSSVPIVEEILAWLSGSSEKDDPTAWVDFLSKVSDGKLDKPRAPKKV